MPGFSELTLLWLVIFAAGFGLQAVVLRWACQVCTMESVTYMRATTIVALLLIVNASAAWVMIEMNIELNSPLGIAIAAIISTALLIVATPADPFSALLILMISAAASGVAYLLLTTSGLLSHVRTLG